MVGVNGKNGALSVYLIVEGTGAPVNGGARKTLRFRKEGPALKIRPSVYAESRLSRDLLAASTKDDLRQIVASRTAAVSPAVSGLDEFEALEVAREPGHQSYCVGALHVARIQRDRLREVDGRRIRATCRAPKIGRAHV